MKNINFFKVLGLLCNELAQIAEDGKISVHEAVYEGGE